MVDCCSVSYLTDTALEWEIRNQIQEAQAPYNSIALVQGFGAVTDVSSFINKERNKNPIGQIGAEEVLGLFHCLQLDHDGNTPQLRTLPKLPLRCTLATDCLVHGYFLFAHLKSTGKRKQLLGS